MTSLAFQNHVLVALVSIYWIRVFIIVWFSSDVWSLTHTSVILIIVINLIGSRITMETRFWACL